MRYWALREVGRGDEDGGLELGVVSQRVWARSGGYSQGIAGERGSRGQGGVGTRNGQDTNKDWWNEKSEGKTTVVSMMRFLPCSFHYGPSDSRSTSIDCDTLHEIGPMPLYILAGPDSLRSWLRRCQSKLAHPIIASRGHFAMNSRLRMLHVPLERSRRDCISELFRPPHRSRLECCMNHDRVRGPGHPIQAHRCQRGALEDPYGLVD